jgi:hypothetical protein
MVCNYMQVLNLSGLFQYMRIFEDVAVERARVGRF